MNPEYFRPRTLTGALERLDQYGDDAKIIAGGTAVVLLLQQKLIAPKVLVDLTDIPELSEIRPVPDGLHLGPLVTLSQLAKAAEIRSTYPALAHAAGTVGNVRIRNQATIGGNLAEADYASDPPACLFGLDTRLELTSSQGSREVPISDFTLGMYATALAPHEILTGITLPPLPQGCRMAYFKFRTRSSEDRPCLGVAGFLTQQAGSVTDLRIVVGAASDIPQRLPDIEAESVGQTLTDRLIDEIADAYGARIDTLDDLRGSSWYRKEMIRVHVGRVLKELRDGNR